MSEEAPLLLGQVAVHALEVAGYQRPGSADEAADAAALVGIWTCIKEKEHESGIKSSKWLMVHQM